MIKNAKEKKITVTDSTGNSTSQVYGSYSSNYEERWFIEDNNFSTNEISSILQDTNMSTSNVLGQVTTYDTNNILANKQSSIITYSQDKNK